MSKKQLPLVQDPKKNSLPGRTFERTQGCWNCVTGDALILGPSGAVRLDEAQDLPAALNFFGMDFTNGWRAAGIQPTLIVETNYGAKLKVTPDHEILTDRGWVAAIDLRIKDEVRPIHRGLQGTEHRPELAEVMGAIVGDGWKLKNGLGFGFRSEMLEAWRPTLAKAADIFESLERPHLKNQGKFYQLEWRNEGARFAQRYVDKARVPAWVWISDDQTVAAYLRGLFSTDGSLGDRAIRFYQVTESLVRDLQLLLRTLGIASHHRIERRQDPHQDLHVLSISRRESLERFSTAIGFVDQRRNDKLKEYVATTYSRGTPERILRVTQGQPEPVFDVSIPRGESFFANGILVHNCRHFDNGEKSKNHWKKVARPREEANLKFLRQTAPQKADGFKELLTAAQAAIFYGKMGMCLAGKVKTEFVEDAYLCPSWTGRQGASVARAGGGPDLLPEELREVVDGDSKGETGP